MFHPTKMTVIAVALATATATAAHAAVLGTVDATYNNNNPTGTARIFFDFGDTSYSNVHVYTGRSNFTVSYVSEELIGYFPGDQFQAFCVDFQQEITKSTHGTWELVQLSEVPYPSTQNGYPNGMGEERAGWLQRLFEQHYGSIDNPDPDSETQRKINATAFQIAAWDLIYDAVDNDVKTGNQFRVNDVTSGHESDVYTLANAWVADAKANGQQGGSVYALRSETTQDFALILDDFEVNDPNPVPLPAAAWMGMVLLGSLATGGGIRRLRWKDA